MTSRRTSARARSTICGNGALAATALAETGLGLDGLFSDVRKPALSRLRERKGAASRHFSAQTRGRARQIRLVHLRMPDLRPRLHQPAPLRAAGREPLRAGREMGEGEG